MHFAQVAVDPGLSNALRGTLTLFPALVVKGREV